VGFSPKPPLTLTPELAEEAEEAEDDAEGAADEEDPPPHAARARGRRRPVAAKSAARRRERWGFTRTSELGDSDALHRTRRTWTPPGSVRPTIDG
jgi:hypothetical protein